MIYLDNAATTRISAAAMEVMRRTAQENFGNPSSLHLAGVRAEETVDKARRIVANMLGAQKKEIYFAPSGTFCNNMAILGAARTRKRTGGRIVTTTIEHACVRESVKSLENEGFEVVFCEPTEQALRENINADTVLVSCMYVNNETGLILPVDKLADIIKENNAPALLHIDAVQAFGKIPVSVRALGCDLLTVSAHKIHGPKGCAALFVKDGVRLLPILFGGGQEKGLVSGTHNSPAIAGFGAAVQEAQAEFQAHQTRLSELQDYFLKRAAEFDFLQVNRDSRPHAPHIINVSFMGYVGENVLHFLEGENVYVSVGSACSNNTHHGSILAAMHQDAVTVDGAIRVSFGYDTVRADIDAFFAAAQKAADTLIRKYRRSL